jgi:methyltransferase (TIGR00027 family)
MVSQQAMNDIRNVTGTAFVVAEFRAGENSEPKPIYIDPVVPIFLDERTKRAAAMIEADFPPGVMNVKIRTRYFDDQLEHAIAGGCRQVVILGAGLDTRAERKTAPGVAYFEIDDANTLGFKRERLEAAGYKAVATFIPGDYVASGVLPLVEANGFDRTLPTFFIWEGNTMYLTREMDMNVLRELKNGLASFGIAFDYMSDDVIACATGDDGVTGFVERFAAMGAPWITGFNDVAAIAKEAGLVVADNTTTADLHRAYWPGRPIATRMFDHYSLCTLARRS